MEVFGKILSFVKESTKTFFIIAGLCIAIIFFSENLGTESIQELFNPYLKLTLIVCILGIVANCSQFIFNFANRKYQAYTRRKNSINRLNNLSKAERLILAKYIMGEVRVLSLDTNDGTIADLTRCGFIFQSTPYMDGGSYCQHNITDWTWDYLLKNKRLVCGD